MTRYVITSAGQLQQVGARSGPRVLGRVMGVSRDRCFQCRQETVVVAYRSVRGGRHLVTVPPVAFTDQRPRWTLH